MKCRNLLLIAMVALLGLCTACIVAPDPGPRGERRHEHEREREREREREHRHEDRR